MITQDKGGLHVQLRESQAAVQTAQLATQRLEAEHQQVATHDRCVHTMPTSSPHFTTVARAV